MKIDFKNNPKITLYSTS